MDKLNISAFLRVVERTVYQMIRQTGQRQGRAGSPLKEISPRRHTLWVSLSLACTHTHTHTADKSLTF